MQGTRAIDALETPKVERAVFQKFISNRIVRPFWKNVNKMVSRFARHQLDLLLTPEPTLEKMAQGAFLTDVPFDVMVGGEDVQALFQQIHVNVFAWPAYRDRIESRVQREGEV